jgi:putative aldouronate transport system permease protein
MWKITGYKSIVYFSTIIGFDPAYYEAARVDGAGRWQQIRFITLPALKTTVVILTLMSLGRIFYTDFGLFYHVPMNQGTLMNVTNTIDTYVYRGLMNNSDIGMTAAAGFYQSVIGFMVVFTANWIVRKTDGDSALF